MFQGTAAGLRPGFSAPASRGSRNISQADSAEPANVKLAQETGQNSARYFSDWALPQLDMLIDGVGELVIAQAMLAQRLTYRLAQVRKKGILPWVRPDGKSQITVEYDGEGRPRRVHTVLVSTQHDPDVDLTDLSAAVREHVVEAAIPGELLDGEGVGPVIRHRREIVEAVGVRHRPEIGDGLAEFFVVAVEITEHGLELPRRLQIEFSQAVQQVMDTEGHELTAADLWRLFDSEYHVSTTALPRYRLHQGQRPTSARPHPWSV